MSRPVRHFGLAPALFPRTLLSLAIALGFAELAYGQTPAFVQARYAVPQTPQTAVTLAYTGAQTAGNLNVVAIGWNDATTQVQAVTDSRGNVYSLAAGPTVQPGVQSQVLYYAPNIASAAANANAVTVTFSAAADYPDLRIAEYTGLSPTAPLEAAAGASGIGTLANSGAVSTSAQVLLVGASYTQSQTTGPGTGYTQRLLTNPNGSILEDRVVTTAGSYSATAPTTGAGWVMQLAVFRAAGGGADSQAPTAPTGLGATAISSTQINLAWTASTDNVGVTGYRVERCQAAGCTSFAQIATPSVTSYSDTGLSAATSYSYRVRATDAAGNLSGYSATATTLTSADSQAPTAPTGLGATAISSTQINLAWTASTDNVGVTGYRVERCQAAGCTSFAQIATPSVTSYSDIGLSATTSYSYRVRATDAAGNLSGYSATASATTSSGGAAPITFIQARYAVPQTPQTAVTLAYTGAQTAGNLNVVAIGWNDATTQVQAVTDSRGNVYSLAAGPTVQPGVQSQVLYYAPNIAGAAANANAVTVTFSAAADYPDLRIAEYTGLAPTAPLEAAAGASGIGTLANSGAVSTSAQVLLVGASYTQSQTTGPGTGYTQRLLTNPNGSILEDRVVTTAGSYSATAPTTGAGWVMQLAVFRAAGGGADSQAPTAPTGLGATAISSTQINLAWTASTDNVGVTGYRVERCQAAGCTSFAQIATPSVTGYSDIGLTAGTSYSYRVRATDAAGNLSGYSATATTLTSADSQAPTAPTGLGATAISSTQINLAWTASTDNVGVTGYRVERCQAAGCTSFAQIATPSVTSYSDIGLSATTSYSYRVRATDAAGNLSGYSATASATTSSGGAAPITFIQARYAVPQTPQTAVTLAYTGAQTAGNLNVVAIGWNDATTQVQAVTDSRGNVYSLAAGPTVQPGVQSQVLYYAPNIAGAAANANAVTVTFSAAADYPDLRIAEYTGLAPTAPLEAAAGASGIGTLANSGAVSTSAQVLLVGASYTQSQTTGPGTGYTQRLLTNPNGSILEDRVVTTAGSYSATAPTTGAGWVMQLAVFRAAGGGADSQAPTAPTGLGATAISSTQINLAWTASTDNVGVTGYRVERCQAAGCTSFAQIATPSVTSYSDTGLSAATSYSYRVRATDAAGNLSGYSATATTLTSADSQAPTAPTGLGATAISSTQINLAWTASTDNVGVTGYRVERCQAAGCTSFAQIATPSVTSYSDTGLSAATSYSYRVRATDAAGNLSGYSSTATATTADGQAPTAPTGLGATAISSTQINLSWTASTDNVGVTGYRVERCQAAGCTSFAQIATPSVTSYSDTGLSAATSYSYRVRATDAAGNLSGYSATATTLTSADSQAPTAPTGLGATAISSTQINLAWTASTDNVGVTGYRVERCQAAGCTSFAQIATPSVTSYSDTGLSAATSYSYRVRATDAAGNLSGYSATATTLTSADSQAPTAPTGLGATAISSTQINLAWTASTDNVGVTGYRVERCQAAGCTSFAQIATPSVTSYSDTGLSAATSYSYRVRATDAAGNLSGYSATATTLTSADSQAPTAPTGLGATAISSTQINLAWTASTDDVGVTGYRVERCQAAGCTSFAQIATPSVTSYSDTGLSAATSYSYRVRATDAAGNLSGYSATATTLTSADSQAPTAPTGLGATAISSTQINLAWTASTDNVGVTGYRVERCQAAGCTNFAQIATPSVTSYSDTGLSAATSYSYRVRATDAAGNLSGYSATATTLTSADSQAPTAPTGLGATAISSTQINLAWTASTDNVGVTGYRVERCQAAGCTSFAQIATPSVTSYSDTGLSAATSYSYRVRATDAAGNLSGYSATASATTSSGGAAPITFIQARYAVPQTPQTAVTLAYTGAQTAGNLNVVAIGWNDATTQVQAVTDSRGNVYSLAAGPTVQPGVQSQVLYYAPNIASAAANANAVTVTFSAAADYPDLRIAEYTGLAPTAPLEAAAGASGIGTLANSGAVSTSAQVLLVGASYTQSQTTGPGTGYTQRLLTNPNGSILEDRVVTTAGSYSATAPTTGAGWVMQLAVFRAAGGGADSQAPTAPTGLGATAISSTQINLAWTASTDNVGVTGYRVERCQAAGCTSFVQIATPSVTSYSDTGLSAATSYSYRVRATDAAGNLSGYSSTATATTLTPSDTTAPQVFIDNPVSGAQISDIVTVTADASDNVGVAGVQFLVDGTPVGAEDTEEPYSVDWDTRAVSNGEHTLMARARDEAGNFANSPDVVVNVSSINYFLNEILATGFDLPTNIEFLPDSRMLVVELAGTIKVLPPPYTTPDPVPFLQLNLNISGYAALQQGIFDIMLDPNFTANHYYYVFYTKDTPNRDRLSRFTANAALDGTIAGSEVILYQDPQTPATEHHGGAINFGNDGKIYFTTGEHFNAANAQDLTNPRGKIHRINADGTIPTDNPFYDGTGPQWDSIWAYGLRNPFRAYYDTPTGRFYIADVGGNDYSTAQEEVDLGVAGRNYGWPNCELGTCGNPGYTPALYAYAHNGRDASITGGFVYHGSAFPSGYQGSYFFADYTQNWIRRLTFDAQGNVTGTFNFEPADGSVDGPYGDIVHLTEGPDGALYYVDLGYSDVGAGSFGVSKIRRVRYVQADLSPTCIASANPVTGLAPLAVNFSSAGSSDPEGQALTYTWIFGDGATSTTANPVHTYSLSGPYDARLTVSDGVNDAICPPIAISVGNPPAPTIFSPITDSTFIAGDVISYSGDATDTEDGVLPASAFLWFIDFLHAGHVHPGVVQSGVKGDTFTIPTDGHDFSGNTRYRITLIVTDSDGLQASTSTIIYPHKVNLSFDTVPGGLTLYLDGIARTTPFIHDTLANFHHTIEARNSATATTTYTFSSWSDGGAQTHTLTVPAASQNYVATYTTSVAPITLGETAVLGSDDSGNGNLLVVQDATLSQDATLQSLSFYVTTASGDLRLGIYDATGSGGGPGVLEAQTNAFTPVVGWNTATVITPTFLLAGNYWLAYFASSSNLHFATDFSSGSYEYANLAFGAMPATFPTSAGRGTTHWSLYGTASLTPDAQAPTAPSGLGATAISSTQINLAWTASTDNVAVTGYRVERCQAAGCTNFAQIATPSVTSYSDTGLTAATNYSFRVRATDAAGNLSGYSSTATATTLTAADAQAPTAPTGLGATAISSTQVNLAWTASTDNVGVTGYRVERCQAAGCTNFAQIATPSVTSYSDTGLSAATSYSYRVRATDAAGNLSGYSATATTLTSADSQAPTAPTGLGATAISSTQINLAWTASTDNVGVTGYRVERCQAAGCTSFAQIATPSVTSYSDIGLSATTSYSYRVRATDAAGNLSGYSATASATTSSGGAAPITFIQARYAVPQTPQTAVTLAYTGAQTAGNLNVVAIGWNDATTQVQAVTDSRGNVYSLAAGPTVQPGVQSQVLYYAPNIAGAAANANAVTVTFSAAADYPDLRIAEYTGLAPTAPLEAAAGASGIGTLANSGAVSTSAQVLLVGASYTQSQTTGPGTGYTQRLLTNPNGSILEDRVVTTAGSYSATAPTTGAGWVMQLAVFRAAGGGADSQAPTAPTGLGATAISSTQINLAWTASTDNVGVTGYRVERCQAAGCTSFAQIATPSVTSYSDTGLTDGTSYSYRVRATDAAGNLSGYSSTATATTADGQAPTAPTGLGATAISSTQINLSWTASTDNVGVTGYRVERCQAAGCTNFAQIATPSVTSYSDTGLSAATSYSYRVRATDAAGNLSGYSATATTLTSADSQAPTAPTGLGATAISSTQINLAWTASTDDVGVTGYRVERCQAAGCTSFAQIATPSVTSYSDTGLSAATSYSYRVRATDAAGNLSGYSATATTLTSADSQAPTAPTGLGATAISSTQINLSWTASTDNVGVTGYRVERCQAAGCTSFAQIATPSVTSYSDTGLSAATSYSYRVRATDAAGNLSGYSSTATATTLDSAPGSISISTPEAGTVVSATIPLTADVSGAGIVGVQFQVDGVKVGPALAAPYLLSFNSAQFANGSHAITAYMWDGQGNLQSAAPVVVTFSNSSPGNPAQTGLWSELFSWPLVTVHINLLAPDGRVLAWDRMASGNPDPVIWDPITSAFAVVPVNDGADLFCAGHITLPDGRIFSAGGHFATHVGLRAGRIFDPVTNLWTSTPDMTYGRWYPTLTTLPDGRILVLAGEVDCRGCNAVIPEIYDPVSNTWATLPSASLDLPYYPHVFVLPDGRILVTGTAEDPIPSVMLDLSTQTWSTIDSGLFDAYSSAMYLPGKILKSGTSTDTIEGVFPSSPRSYVLDMTVRLPALPAWREVGPMEFPRTYHTETLLPDGSVLVTGGGRTTDSYDVANAVRQAELWSPTTETWTTLGSGTAPRIYHSTALLLPDATVLVSGGGRSPGPDARDQENAEVFAPPYLFKGPRPVITAVATDLTHNQPFLIQTPDAARIETVALIAVGNTTHGLNMNQRYLPLDFSTGAGTLTATAPLDTNLAPPGWYMLFVVDTAGVPSVASFVRF